MATLNIFIVSKYKIGGGSDWIYKFFPQARRTVVNIPASNDDSSYNDIVLVGGIESSHKFCVDYHVELFTIESDLPEEVVADKVWVVCPSVYGDEVDFREAMRRCHCALGDLYDIDYSDIAACDYGVRLTTTERKVA